MEFLVISFVLAMFVVFIFGVYALSKSDSKGKRDAGPSINRISLAPENIKSITGVVRRGQREPSMGRTQFVWAEFAAANDKMYDVICSKGLRNKINLKFVVSDGEIDQHVVDHILQEETSKGFSVCVQSQWVHYVKGSGPDQVALVTVFATPEGEEQKVLISELSMLPEEINGNK